jgi:hypothetical protein
MVTRTRLNITLIHRLPILFNLTQQQLCSKRHSKMLLLSAICISYETLSSGAVMVRLSLLGSVKRDTTFPSVAKRVEMPRF